MKALREKESNADLGHGLSKGLNRHLDVHPESFHHIGAAALARSRTVSMLGDRHPSSRNDEGRSRRDIERAGSIASGTAGVHNRPRLSVPEGFGLLAHHP